jgi:hypothetical protein
MHFGIGNIAELRFLTENYVIVSEESFGLESVGQVVLLSFNSVIENVGLDYLEPYSNFSSLDEVHLLHLLAFLINDVSVSTGREVSGHETKAEHLN